MTHWFEADKDGLRKLLEKRGLQHVLYELISNAWDTEATVVTATLEPVAGKPLVEIVVEDDDPQGFATLAHAWTLFAESNRKADVSKRGRFNLGEKLVLACCTSAEIASTTGTVTFDNEGRHEHPRRKRASGSSFHGLVPMTRAQMDEVIAAARLLIPPPGVTVTFNGQPLISRERVAGFEVELPTEFADEEGCLHRTRRLTDVLLYDPMPGQPTRIYELGVPVVTHECQWDVDVCQKIPLTMDRTNVTPAFIAELQVAVLNDMHDHVRGEAAAASWVTEAISHPDASKDAVTQVVTERFGEGAVAYDPSDTEANKRLAGLGKTVVPGRALPAAAWSAVRAAGALPAAGRVSPTPKPFSEDGPELKRPKVITPEMDKRTLEIDALAKALLGHGVMVEWAADVGWPFGGAYDRKARMIIINLGRCYNSWVTEPLWSERVLSLLIHEFAHDLPGDHLSHEYQENCCKLGALCVKLAFERPELFGKGKR
jgi:hypothetical protein